MEKEYRISWLKVIGILVLIVILVAILCFIYPKKNSKKTTSSIYINNINSMKQAGFEYFRGSSLPDKIGASNKITLDEMITSNLIVEFFDENGNTCNKADSYVEATKTLEDEYTMKVFLSCDNKSDYIITTITGLECLDCNKNDVIIDESQNNTESNSTNNNVADKETNNSNSSSSTNNSYKPTPNNKVTYVTNYNINYVNNCNNCSGSNCSNNCIYNVYHTVNFNSNNGSKVDSQIVKHGENATYEVSYREGYTFLGWYLDGVKYDFSTPVTKKITLIAKWKKIEENKYTVRFDSNGGTKVSSQTVKEGETAYEPKDPTRECYLFVAWYTDKALTKKYDFDKEVTKDMTLYAKWEDDDSCKNKYTVRFDSNGGTKVTSQSVEEGDRASEPKNPTRTGYTFLGWYLDEKEFNFRTRIYEDIILEALWEKDEELYYTYCKVENKTYYSTSYVSASQNTWNYNWTIKFDDLYDVQDLEVISHKYLTTTNHYNKAYRDYINGKDISMVGGNTGYEVPITSGSILKTYSLKSTNFYKYLSVPYYSNGSWYVDASINIRNYNNLTEYYASNIGRYIYFVPFYFEVSYTNMNKCYNDKASKASSYSDYKVKDYFYR